MTVKSINSNRTVLFDLNFELVCIFPKWKFQTENSKIKIPKWKFQNVSVKDQHCRIIYLEGCIWNISGLVISSHADLLSISDHVKQAQVLSSSIPDSSSSLQLPLKSRWQAEKFYLGWDKPRDQLQRFKTFNL